MPVILKVEQRAQADFLVCVVEKRSEADLFVCEVENRAMARNPAYWFYTDNRPDAIHSILVTDSRAAADLNIYMVESRGEAGWRVADHPLMDVLG
jgi:hypothetical protein